MELDEIKISSLQKEVVEEVLGALQNDLDEDWDLDLSPIDPTLDEYRDSNLIGFVGDKICIILGEPEFRKKAVQMRLKRRSRSPRPYAASRRPAKKSRKASDVRGKGDDDG